MFTEVSAMKRFWKWVPFVFACLLLLLSLSASAATAPAAKAKPLKLRTLVSEKGTIHAFVQDGNVIAWVGRGSKVHVRSLTARAGAIVGTAGRAGPGLAMHLALAGSRVSWVTLPTKGSGPFEASLMTAVPWNLSDGDRFVHQVQCSYSRW